MEPATLILPRGQYIQDVRVLPAYVPAGQDSHDVEPARLKRPAVQARQVVLDVAAGVLLYVPAAQGVHADRELAPKVLLYVPAGHGAHDVSPVLVLYLPS